MHNAITWASLFGVGGIIGGLMLGAVGVLAIFAGGMSDAPTEGASTSRLGCTLTIIGAIILAVGIWMVR